MATVRTVRLVTGGDLAALRRLMKVFGEAGVGVTLIELMGTMGLGKEGRFTVQDWTEVRDYGRKRVSLAGMVAVPTYPTEDVTFRVTVEFEGDLVEEQAAEVS